MCESTTKLNGGGQGMSCTNCQTTKTPLWRRSDKGDLLCNACGLYAKSRNGSRPISKRVETNTKKESCLGTCPGDGHCNGTGGSSACSGCPAFNQRSRPTQSGDIKCANCISTTTPLWRRDDKGATICNACGLYFKMHGHHRPVAMRKTTIKRRNRISQREVTESNLDTSCCSHGNCPATPEDIENCQPLLKQSDCLPKITVAMTDGPLVPIKPKQFDLSHIINPPASPTLNRLSKLPPLILENNSKSNMTLPSLSSLGYFSFPTSPLLPTRLSDPDDKLTSSQYNLPLSSYPDHPPPFENSPHCKKSKLYHPYNLPPITHHQYIPPMSYPYNF